MQAWNPGASEIPMDDRLESSSRGLSASARLGTGSAGAQAVWGKPGGYTGQAPCCHPLSHPDVLLHPSI